MQASRSVSRAGQICLKACVFVATVAALCPDVWAQEASGTRIWTVGQRFQGSSSAYGQVLKASTDVSYQASRHVGLHFGVPYYFFNYASVEEGSSQFRNGIGNVYAALSVSFTGAVNYTSTVTGTAPTGSWERGLSTGRPSLDWNNFFQKVIAQRVAPYANVGVANTVSDTPFFIRPFNSAGLVGHFEAGSTVSLSSLMYAGGSAYRIVPNGVQTVVSRIVEVQTVPQPTNSLPANSRGKGLGLKKNAQPDLVFETTHEVIGQVDSISDRGFSAWAGIGPIKNFDVTFGFSRSNRYELNTIFWGIGMRLATFQPGRDR